MIREETKFIINCVGGERIEFFTGTYLNPTPGVYYLPLQPITSPIYVIGHQGLTREGCKDEHDLKEYQWPDSGN
jgi:hypothetical protein